MKERYLHSVRALMDCPPEEKERLLSRLSHAVTAYLEDVPGADETDLVANFGTPEDCAVKLLAECAPKEIAAERRKKIRRHRIVVIVLAVLLAAILCFALYLWAHGGIVTIKLMKRTTEVEKEFPPGRVTYYYED